MPPFRNTVVPALLLAATIVASVVADLGGMAMLRWVAAACLATYFVLRWAAMSTIARRLLGFVIVLAAAVLASADNPGALALDALRPGLFLASFIASVNILRSAARQSPLLRKCGGHILGQPPARRYAALSLGTSLAGVILLFSVMNLFGTMVVQGARTAGATQADTRRGILAVVRGLTTTAAISPLAVPYAGISAIYVDMQWGGVFPFLLAGVVLMWVLGWLVDAAEPAPGMAVSGGNLGPWTVHLKLAGLIAFLVGAVICVKWLAGVRMAYGVIFSVPVFALGWLVFLRRRAGPVVATFLALRRVAAGWADDRNEITILSTAGFAGGLIAHLMPSGGLGHVLAAMVFPPALIPAAIILAFILAGQLAVQPVMVFVVVAAAFPDAAAAGLPPEILFATYFFAWSLMSITSPFNIASLLPARIAGISSFTLCWRWNALYGVAATVLVAVLMGVFALIFET
jgi:hypothetical protein